jgi:hypothetical protein
MITFVIAIGLIALFPFIMRSFFAVIGIVCVVGIVAMARAESCVTTPGLGHGNSITHCSDGSNYETRMFGSARVTNDSGVVRLARA